MSYRCVSADSHILEPPDLWVSRIEPRLRDRAPRVEPGPNGNLFHCEGRQPESIRALGTPFAVQGTQTEAGRCGGWDPDVRLEDMAVDGVLAEVLYPSMALLVYSMPDGDLQAACFRAYNDWLAEFCRAHPKALYGVALIPMFDVGVGVEELRRARGLGLRGAAIWGTPPDDYSFVSDRYDPFWAEAQELNVPVSLHCFTGPSQKWTGNFLIPYTMSTQRIQESLTTLIFSGVFERFPSLRVISVENDIGWVPYLMQRMDYGYERKGKRRGVQFKSSDLPSDIFRRNVMATFMSDAVGVQMLGLMGTDMLMWATDYPHDDSTWPESQKVIEKQFGPLGAEDRNKLILQNAVELYGIDLS